jgi:hypothetical protein
LDALKGYFEGTKRVGGKEQSSEKTGEEHGESWGTWDENWDKVVYEDILGFTE